MRKTHSLSHDDRGRLLPLLQDYRAIMNHMIEDIWASMEWKEVLVKATKYQRKSGQVTKYTPMKQKRLLPYYNTDNKFKKQLRDKYLIGWQWADHWVDSAEKIAFSTMKSWESNYVNGDRKKNMPVMYELKARVKQTLSKLEGDRLRITLKPHQYVWIDLSGRYFQLPKEMSAEALGEPIISPDMIYLPVPATLDYPIGGDSVMGWDSNLKTLDGFNLKNGWVRIETDALIDVHKRSLAKRSSIQKARVGPKTRERLMKKYSGREGNRAEKHQIEIARTMRQLANRNRVERLRKKTMFTKSNWWNKQLSWTDWRGIVTWLGDTKEETKPDGTSKKCSRCGCVNQDLKVGDGIFKCVQCCLCIDRQLNGCINIYLAEGASHDKTWWDSNVLPVLVGGCFLSGDERLSHKVDPDELVRGLAATVSPKTTYVYDRYADAYLPLAT